MADFVIIGGGVYGCAVAWELTKRGAEVCLLEANTIASGASGGMGHRGVRANGRDVRELPFMREAYDIWPTLHEQLSGDTGYDRAGHLLLIEREQDLDPQAAHCWLQQQNGIESQVLDYAQVRELEPNVSDNILAAVFCPNDGTADHTATTRSYAAAARRLGADIREHTAAVGLERDGNRVTAIITSQDERIEVNRGVLLASNVHVQRFVQTQLGVQLPLWRMYPQVMKTEPVTPIPVCHLIGHAHRTLAIKVVPDNRVMVSGGWHGVVNETTGVVESDQAQIDGNFAEAVAVYPSLTGVQVAEVSVERPELIAIDGIPIIDRLPQAENMLVAVGWSGHGWAIAPSASKHMADWLFTNNRPALLQPFSYQRFFRS